MLDEILSLAEKYKPHAVIIAGDVYDKPVPSAEAVSLLDGFLTALSERKIKTFIIRKLLQYQNHNCNQKKMILLIR